MQKVVWRSARTEHGEECAGRDGILVMPGLCVASSTSTIYVLRRDCSKRLYHQMQKLLRSLKVPGMYHCLWDESTALVMSSTSMSVYTTLRQLKAVQVLLSLVPVRNYTPNSHHWRFLYFFTFSAHESKSSPVAGIVSGALAFILLATVAVTVVVLRLVALHKTRRRKRLEREILAL